MITKKELLILAGKEFPQHYFEKKKHNPEMFFRKNTNFPEVTIFYASRIRNVIEDWEIVDTFVGDGPREEPRIETIKVERQKINYSIVVRTAKKKKAFAASGICYTTADDADCLVLAQKLNRNIIHFVRFFSCFFVFNFLPRRDISLSDWNMWDEINRHK